MDLIKLKSRPTGKMTFSDMVPFFSVIVFAFVLSMQSSMNLWMRGTPEIDASVFQYIGMMMAKGYTPYLDVFDHKGPLLYLLNMVGWMLAPSCGIWFVEWVSLSVFFCLMYKTARLHCGKFCSVLVTVIAAADLFPYFTGGNYTEEFALPFTMFALYVFEDYFENGHVTAWRLTALGVCFAAVLMLRPNLAAVWVTMCLGVVAQCVLTKQAKKIVYYVKYFLLGTVGAMAPVLIWLWVKGAFQDFLYDYITFNMKYSAFNAPKDTVYTVSHFVRGCPFLWVCFAVLGYQMWRHPKGFGTIYAITTVFSLVVVLFGGREYNHYFIAVIPLFVYPLSVTAGWCEKGNGRAAAAGFFALAWLMMNTAFPEWLGGFERVVGCYDVRTQVNRYPEDMQVVELIQAATDEQDGIAVYGVADVDRLCLYSGRLSISKYAYQSVARYDPAIWQAYYQDVVDAQPKIVVLQKKFTYTADFQAVQEYEEQIYGYVQNGDYTLVWDGGWYQVYQRIA